MLYTKNHENIQILDKKEFNICHILECGQVFCYEKIGEEYIVFPSDEYAEIEETEFGYVIKTKNPDFFENYFDLKQDYSKIKQTLLKEKIMQKPIEFGSGIRILNQDILETIVSFMISANNNISRIKLILNKLRAHFGKEIAPKIYAFPSLNELKSLSQEDFASFGAGYRSKYLFETLQVLSEEKLQKMRTLNTKDLREKLISLKGIGEKVADCILLFGFHKGDVFPVDTWIEKMYNEFFGKENNRNKIRKTLISKFGTLSGYAQQYLFFFQRSFLKK